MSEEQRDTEIMPPNRLSEGVDYYFDNGLMVLTAHFLRRRGYCCGNGCRHCPYPSVQPEESQQKSLELG